MLRIVATLNCTSAMHVIRLLRKNFGCVQLSPPAHLPTTPNNRRRNELELKTFFIFSSLFGVVVVVVVVGVGVVVVVVLVSDPKHYLLTSPQDQATEDPMSLN